MDELARLNTEEREEVFAIAADSLGIPRVVVEKDFWICWTLGRLFARPLIMAIGPGADGVDLTDRLVFKGGTSLSKVYGVIDRFSEDIDITVDRAFLGIHGPRADDSRKSRDRLREAVERSCHGFVNNQLLAALHGILRIELKADDDWRLDSDSNAREPTLVFRFPTTSSTNERYLMPAIRIEVGARGAHEPAENAQVAPMAVRAVPQAFTEPSTRVRVMSAARTYWEKATLLHMLHHRGAPIVQRHARHYFDMHQLADHPLGRAACADRALLRRVIDHRELMDPTPTARYREAAEGLIRLAPRPQQLPSLEQDYHAMRDMFLTEPPKLAEIVTRLRRLEEEING